MRFTDTKAIELLSPARNLECGIAAIDHGADAVYIGAQRYGARAAAGNSVGDIATLCRYAHQFGARVYVTVNTILYDDELEAVCRLVWELYEAGVDALIVQDTALLEMDLPPIALHASTQMDNRSARKVAWLHALGFRQAVLARELSIGEIAEIHCAVPEMALEAFCHGALCVSYSGCCYASQYCFSRSANRGECAQFCRLPFSLIDGAGRTLVRDRHLLSLRDMNRGQWLEQMMDAGVSSFKIEGRLKDVAYVKNVTAWYRRCLDDILCRRPEFVRSSIGRENLRFTPDPERSFSRGFTEYFLHGRQQAMSQPETPKSRGPLVGVVKEVRGDVIIVSGTASFHNGDGLCFLNEEGRLQGFRVNRAEGNHIHPARMPAVTRGVRLWRSRDQEWEQLMAGTTAQRRIRVEWTLEEADGGFCLAVTREDGASVMRYFEALHQAARSDQSQVIGEVLGRLGDTIYESAGVGIHFTEPWFVPRSQLAEWRRQLIDALSAEPVRRPCMQGALSAVPVRQTAILPGPSAADDPSGFIPAHLSYRFNVSNCLARRFYEQQGAERIDPAMELDGEAFLHEDARVMTCRFCLKYERGWCPRHQAPGVVPPEPYFLVAPDGRRYRLSFDCRNCEMTVLAPDASPCSGSPNSWRG